MQNRFKTLIALGLGFTLSHANADLLDSSSLNNDNDNNNLAARVINNNGNTRVPSINNLSITERSADKIRVQTLAAKIKAPQEESSVIDRLNAVASNTVRKFSQTGIASWYGRQFHGRKTASGDTFDMNELTAAHRSLPLNCYIRVTNKDNGKSVVVKVNDRGPFHGNRVLDLSYGAAKRLGVTNSGTAKVGIERVNGPTS